MGWLHTSLPEHECQPGPAPNFLEHSEILGSRDLFGPVTTHSVWGTSKYLLLLGSRAAS